MTAMRSDRNFRAPRRDARVAIPRSSLLADIPIAIAALAAFYALLSLSHYWATPAKQQTRINLNLSSLPRYALFSVERIAVAYACSLIFSIAYGYIAARSRAAERFMIPLLDTLQSIPVLCFLPGVMLSMVALFPGRQIGLELGSILLIFTGQVWNMAFSVYSSLKSIPREMTEVTQLYRLSWWQRFVQLELPHSAVGLIWNSMMAVSAGWFSLMVCEMFVLGGRDLRLPGLGSWLQTASNEGNTEAIVWGLIVMIGVIVLIDQIVWRPLIAWSEKFRFEQTETSEAPDSAVLKLLRLSRLLSRAMRRFITPVRESLTLYFAREELNRRPESHKPNLNRGALAVLSAAAVAVLLFTIIKGGATLARVSRSDALEIFRGAGATFLRVELTLALAALWTIPVGVFIGTKPKLAAIAQPIAQIAASVPAPALFPIILLLLIQAGGGLGIGSIVLLLLGTQWYILFNVIAGASVIPTDLKEVCSIYRLSGVQRWRSLLLPAIFPYLVTGFITASGGAWNASIIAEYFRFRRQTFSITGLGAVISRATDSGDFPVLLAATIVISLMVLTLNWLVWKRLYSLAWTRFTLEFS
jgi:NitT/TauT family transport system permease protein